MWVEYLNVEPHTVDNNPDVYEFKQGSVLKLPDSLGNYLCNKYKNSFKKSSEPVKKEIIKITKETVKKAVSYMLYTKTAYSSSWDSVPVNM